MESREELPNFLSPSGCGVRLEAGEVHVWRAGLALPAPVVDQLAQSLAADERERAGRFHFEKHRQRFLAGRGILRRVLGCYVNLPPERIVPRPSPARKPQLV